MNVWSTKGCMWDLTETPKYKMTETPKYKSNLQNCVKSRIDLLSHFPKGQNRKQTSQKTAKESPETNAENGRISGFLVLLRFSCIVLSGILRSFVNFAFFCGLSISFIIRFLSVSYYQVYDFLLSSKFLDFFDKPSSMTRTLPLLRSNW